MKLCGCKCLRITNCHWVNICVRECYCYVSVLHGPTRSIMGHITATWRQIRDPSQVLIPRRSYSSQRVTSYHMWVLYLLEKMRTDDANIADIDANISYNLTPLAACLILMTHKPGQGPCVVTMQVSFIEKIIMIIPLSSLLMSYAISL